MATKRLMGNDGNLFTFTLGAEITATTVLAAGWYVATAVAAVSGLPTNQQVGYPFYASSATGKKITPKAGDKEILLTRTSLCGVTKSLIEFSKEEVDVTTLCDAIKTYRAGLADVSGTLEGVTTIGVSEPLIGKFIDTVTQAANLGSTTITTVNGDSILLMQEINSLSTNSEATAMYIAPIQLFSYSASASIDGAQTYSSSFKIAPHDTIKPCFYELLAV